MECARKYGAFSRNVVSSQHWKVFTVMSNPTPWFIQILFFHIHNINIQTLNNNTNLEETSYALSTKSPSQKVMKTF